MHLGLINGPFVHLMGK